MEQQGNKSFLKWTLIGILVLVFLVIGAYIYIKNRNSSSNSNQSTTDTTTTTTTTTDTTTDTTSDYSIFNQTDESMTSIFNTDEKQAYNKAKAWNSGATLCAASIKIGSDMSTQGITYSYIYCTSADKNYYFNINYNSDGAFLRALIWQTDYIKSGLSPINRNYLKISFFKALQTAETDGGQAFRSAHPQTSITLNLYRGDPSNYAYWFIEYTDATTPDKLSKQIDANTGDVIRPANETSTSSDSTNSSTTDSESTSSDTTNSNL